MARSLVKPFVKHFLVHDRGWKKIQHELELIGNSFVKVGLPENGDVVPGRKTKKGEDLISEMSELVKVGVWNEFGTKDKRIPERSFMRSSFDEQKKNIQKIVDRMYTRIIDLQETTQGALDKIGVWFVAKVKRKITTLKTPPNAPLTIKLKKSSNPLIDTGQMRASIQHVTEIRRVSLGMTEL